MPDRLLSTFQVADLLGATPGAVVEWIQKGLLPVHRQPDGSLRTSQEALIQFLKTRGEQAEAILARLGAPPAGQSEFYAADKSLPRLDLADLAATEPGSRPARSEGIERMFPLDPAAAPPPQAESEQPAAIPADQSPPAADQPEDWPPAEEEAPEELPPQEPPAPQLPESPEEELPTIEPEETELPLADVEPLPPIEPDLTSQGQDIPEIAAIPAPPPEDQELATVQQPPAPQQEEGELAVAAAEAAELPAVEEPASVEEPAPPEVEVLAAVQQPPPPQEEERAFQTAAPAAPETPGAAEAALALLRDALTCRASDIHLASTAAGLSIRLRIDGLLHEADRCGLSISAATVAAAMQQLLDLVGTRHGDARRPSVGQADLRVDDREVTVTVATCPTAFGQRMVVSIADPHAPPVSLSALGLEEHDERRLAQALAGPSGLVLLAARPGAERTAALEAMVSAARADARSVVTVGHRPSAPLAGLTPIVAGATADFPIAQAVRAAAEQDADIIIADDIRDGQTVPALLEAAEAGRLVLAATSAPSAAAAVAELAEMGVQPWVLASHLKAVVSTVTVRRLCPHCRRQAAPDDEMLTRLGLMREEVGRTYVAGGCDECVGIGYLGVMGCSSAMRMDRELAAALRGGPSRAELVAAVEQAGGRPLLRVGLDLVHEGLTSLEELTRCLPR